MPVRIKYDIAPEFVKPKLGELDVVNITAEEYKLKPTTLIAAVPPIIKENNGDSWYNWTISLSLDGIDTTVKGAEKFFKEVDRISSQITQLLKVIRMLSGNVISVSGFLKFAIKQLARELKEFVDSLTSSGIYMSLIVPNFDKKFPNYTAPVFGGYQEFIQRVNTTCLNSMDSDAPKFDTPDKVGGVIIAMLGGVNDPYYLKNLLDNFKKLGELFGFKIPYPSPAKKLIATPGFYNKSGKKTLGVKLSWEAPISPIGEFFVYKRTNNSKSIPVRVTQDNIDIDVNIFSNSDPIVKIKYIFGRATYSYIDFDVEPETIAFYKIYSVFGDDYLKEHPYLMSINSPIATGTVPARVPKECIPVSELKKYMNLSINGDLLSPFDFEGDWQSVTIRRMLGNQIDSMYDNIDTLSEKLIGLVNTGSDAINDYLKFYGERIEDLLEVLEKLKNLMARLTAYTMKGTFMVLDLPLEKGGMRGFVDRFNKACYSGESKKDTPSDKKSIEDFLKNSVKTEKNTSIAAYNEKGIMLGVILLYGIPDLSDPDRLREIAPDNQTESLKKRLKQTEKAISTFIKMLGLG
jgi:hypothetical protein